MSRSETLKALTANRWFAGLVSLCIHAALLLTFSAPKAEPQISLGALSAPAGVSVSFAVATPTPARPVAKPKPEPKPEPRKKPPEPKPEPKKVKSRPAPKPKPKPKSKPKVEQPKKPQPKPEPKPVKKTEAAAQLSARQQQKTTGLTDTPKIITKPVLRKQPDKLVYPRSARRRNQQGSVLVEAEINKFGDPIALKVIQSSGYSSLDKAALRWVKKLAFAAQPDQTTSQPVKVHMPVVFTLTQRR